MNEKQDREKLFDEFLEVIAKERSTEKAKLKASTSVQNELGVAGDDWGDMLEVLNNKFELDMDGFDCYDYFQDEGFWGLISLPFYLISPSAGLKAYKNNIREKRNLTLGDLFKRVKGKLG